MNPGTGLDALHERVRLKRPVQFSDQIQHHGPDQLRIDFCDRVVAYRATATTVRGISLKVDPPSLAIWPGPEIRVTPVTMTKARVSADGDINPRVVLRQVGTLAATPRSLSAWAIC